MGGERNVAYLLIMRIWRLNMATIPLQARMHQSDIRRKPCNRSPPSGRKKIPLYLVLKGSRFFSAPSAPKNTPKPYIFVFYCIFMHIGPITGLFSTKLSVRTLKCRFLTSGQKFEIFQRPDTKTVPSEMSLKCNLRAF